MTPGNNIYTLLIYFIAFSSFISSKFQTLYFPYRLAYYTWATCVITRRQKVLATGNEPFYKILRNKVNRKHKRSCRVYYETKVKDLRDQCKYPSISGRRSNCCVVLASAVDAT